MVDEKRKADFHKEKEVEMKEKQRRVEAERRPSILKKQVRFGERDPMKEEPNPYAVAIPSKDSEISKPTPNKEKTSKKGPGWLLCQEVEMELDPQDITSKFGKQEVKGFSNEEFFGSLRRDVRPGHHIGESKK